MTIEMPRVDPVPHTTSAPRADPVAAPAARLAEPSHRARLPAAAGGDFARLLQRPARKGVEEPLAPPEGPALAPWQRCEGPPRPRAMARPPPVAATGDRLLVSAGGVEARLRIGSGPLAGAEIHLRQGAGGIDAIVLTRIESSRQTLSVAMEEVARRLQRKGHVLRTHRSSRSR
jgi:hypothetical protein